MLTQDGKKLIFRHDDHLLWIEPWSTNAFRVRATKLAAFPTDDWALSEAVVDTCSAVKIILPNDKDGSATITNGNITASVSRRGKIIMTNSKGNKLLEEYARHRLDLTDPKCSALDIQARELKGIPGGDFHATLRLESLDPDEKIYGMGQYQQPYLNLKGTDIELAQRNSQASVPFAVSSLGYGFLWNNPAVGRAVLGKNVISFESYSTKVIDYWIVAGDSPKETTEAYASVTGHVPIMPEYGLGFWQCKLRYKSQDELLGIAREYKKRKVPLDLIVIDFFHWKYQGEWSFDPEFWPDPKAMMAELKEMGVELMVSIWPTVDSKGENWDEMLEKGLLIRHDRGVRVAMQCDGDVTHFDATNPEAREFVWSKVKKSYFDIGIKVFWLDEAEPEFSIYQFDNYRYHIGPVLQIGNQFPKSYAQGFYEGQTAAGQTNILNLLRCAWAGSQKYGALVWSGDIASSWASFRNQLSAGLNMGMAGIPWWTTDIGGFHGGNPNDPEFRELFVRWFQWGAFCPVMRLHGDREPKPQDQPTAPGAPNEIWSYGDEVYGICVKYIGIREELREYTRSLMKEAHEKGSPVIRTLFYEFPADQRAWELETEYMYGSKYLVVPVLEAKKRKVKVYFPKGADWTTWDGKEKFEGGKEVEVDAPIDTMPVFVRM
ncbi:glycoside hydrolase family 31 protein [Pseudocercospora fijiensis CIRAD86]|uniref:Glycoside hydrolase family 31 protein n=1 Tax=Pseudocercospora fijiensis (strain CIRAD86) TaxID=383855 RepID=M3ALQ5_PSEFD|nr:glycoside hydrolase family 31 protein [Pseudocercospora fijiensis CIRAD86]EME78387.1 glycoside hydrolase family 31 protein [Pseudocercospora fijiensis CIRAD86]